MSDVTHRAVETNGIRMHVAEQGEGTAVILCHGFPESWYSWRHQLPALAGAGFRAIAPDMRGYGGSDRPEAIDQYTLPHLVGDIVGLLDALGIERAVVAGHDWGAPVAWHCALFRPDRFRGVVALSVPYRGRGPTRPTSVMPQTGDWIFYQLYFQTPGVAEAEFEHDVGHTLRSLLTGEVLHNPAAGVGMVPRRGGFIRNRPAPVALPAWLGEADLQFYAGEFARTGFGGGLNWYRNIDRNWELTAPFTGARISVPALYVAGERDAVVAFPGAKEVIANLPRLVPQLRGTVMLPRCGHWTQQERPTEVNNAIIEFLRGLPE